MEAPKPIETNFVDILKEEQNYSLNSDNKNYNINIKNYNSYIVIDYFYFIKENNKYEFEKKIFYRRIQKF